MSSHKRGGRRKASNSTPMALELDREWTYEDYCQLPEDGKRYEVIDGRLYVTPAPSPYHQILSTRLLRAFEPFERAGKGQMLHAPLDVLMPGTTPVQPDLVLIGADQTSMITRRAIEGVPLLLVEILSPSTAGRDRTLKLNKYAGCGVEHYWILDPFARTLELYRLAEGCYRLEHSLGEQDHHEPSEFPGVVLDMPALLQNIPTLD